MSGKLSASSNGTDGNGIDTALLEKRLEGLRDTQESIQGLSLWCQSNKIHSQAITDTWLRILRKSPVEKRLTMFYLANDVVQHAKRKSDITVVNQWAFAVQKATPHVRSPTSVSSAITRIFRIWEERGIYSKDAVADLLSLLNNVSSKDKVEKKKPETYTADAEKVAAFQPSMLISKVKLANRLKSHLGTTFRTKSYCQMDMDTLKNSIKDRQHGQEVIQEMGTLVEQLRTSEMKLQVEVEERRKIVETGETAIVFYENVRSESKIVNAAYKNFTNRVIRAHDAVENKLKSFDDMEKEPSPCPSPPAAAPSPPEDDDFIHHSGMVDNHGSVYDPEEMLQPPSAIDNAVTASSSTDSGLGSQDINNSNLTPYTPTGTPHAKIPAVSSISMAMPPYNPHQHISSGYDSMGLDIQQQLQNWSAANENFASVMMNFTNQQSMTPQPPQNFAVTPSMQLQMQMQQQNILSYGFSGKFEQPDISSIPLPPTNPPVENPPLPPQELAPQYPPLPPQPQNPPLPEGIPVYQQQSQMSADSIPMYSPGSSKSLDNTYSSDSKYPGVDNIFQSQNQHSDNDYPPQSIRPDNVYPPPTMHSPENIYPPSSMQPSDGMSGYQSQNMQQHHEKQTADYQPGSQQSDMSSQDSRFDMKPDHSARSPGFDFEYEPEFVDNHSTKYDRQQQHHYQPKNYHPYNPPQRGRRPNAGGSAPHNIQPLLSPPNPRFQSRISNNNSPRMSRPQGDRYNTPNAIPSLLESPVSHSGLPNKPQNRPNQQQNFDGYVSFDEPGGNVNMGSNGTGMNDDGFQYDHYQPQQDVGPQNLLPMNPNNLRNRPPRRGFRGGFRGGPRMRGNGPGGPRRGRF